MGKKLAPSLPGDSVEINPEVRAGNLVRNYELGESGDGEMSALSKEWVGSEFTQINRYSQVLREISN